MSTQTKTYEFTLADREKAAEILRLHDDKKRYVPIDERDLLRKIVLATPIALAR